MRKKLISNFLIYAIGPPLPKIVSLLILPIITKYLTANDYGIYGIISAYLGMFTALKELGLTLVISNVFYKFPQKYKIVWKQLYGFLSVWSIVLALIIALLLFFVIPKDQLDKYWLITMLVCIPIAFFDTTILFGSRFYNLSQQPLSITVISIVASLIAISVNIVAIVIFHLGYLGWLYAYLASQLFSFIAYGGILFIKLKIRPIFNFKYQQLIPYLIISLPMIPHNYSQYLLDNSDRVLLNIFKIPINLIGQYNFAYMFAGYFALMLGILGFASGPMYLRLYQNNSKKNDIFARNMTFFLQFCVLVVAFTISIWMKEIFQILVKNIELQKTYPIAIIIIMAYSTGPMHIGVISKLQILEKTKVMWKISLFAGLISILLNIVLIPKFGIWGATVSTFIALTYFSFIGGAIKDFKKNITTNFHFIEWFLIFLISTICVYLLRDTLIVFKILITLLAAFSTLLLIVKNNKIFKF